MDKLVFEEQSARIEAMVEEAATFMDMAGQWEFDHVMCEWDPHDQEGSDIPTVYTTAAKTTAQWQYKRAQIDWYVGRIATLSDERLMAVIVHELVHCLLNSLDRWINDDADDSYHELNEYTCEMIARAILVANGRSPVASG